jgi:SOS-response transcriptional repressor LexA
MELDTACGGEPYALQVLGDSMEPEFKNGEVIVIDPDGAVCDGSYVIAMYGNEHIFRQLRIENERYYLKPVNPQYPTLSINGLHDVKGLIIQAGNRRKTRRHYD